MSDQPTPGQRILDLLAKAGMEPTLRNILIMREAIASCELEHYVDARNASRGEDKT